MSVGQMVMFVRGVLKLKVIGKSICFFRFIMIDRTYQCYCEHFELVRCSVCLNLKWIETNRIESNIQKNKQSKWTMFCSNMFMQSFSWYQLIWMRILINLRTFYTLNRRIVIKYENAVLINWKQKKMCEIQCINNSPI